jgi:hypothetical protein
MILFTTLARLESSIEKEILIWEMENSKEEDKLFICRIRKTLQKYNLPSPEEILENPPKKQQWKNTMKKAINSFWYDKWTNEKQIKSTPCGRSMVFSGYSCSSTFKTDLHDITELLLKEAFNTIN